MKKRLSVFAIAFCIFSFAKVFAVGVGPQVNVNPVIPIWGGVPSTWGLACAVKFDSNPFYWAFSLDSGSYTYEDKHGDKVHTAKNSIGITADYHISEGKFSNIWGWYWGFGGALGAAFTSGEANFYTSAGARIFYGMNWKFKDGFIELYAQTAAQPEIGLALGEDGTENGFIRPALYIPSNVGVRFWL